MIVVDASLAVKWLFREADSELALHFLKQQKGELAAPDLIYIEVAGVVVRRGNENKPDRQSALRAIETWTRVYAGQVVKPFDTTPNRLRNAGHIALRIGHPLKDCVYLALARELDAELATCDRKLREKALPLYPNIKLLADYPPASPPSSQ